MVFENVYALRKKWPSPLNISSEFTSKRDVNRRNVNLELNVFEALDSTLSRMSRIASDLINFLSGKTFSTMESKKYKTLG